MYFTVKSTHFTHTTHKSPWCGRPCIAHVCSCVRFLLCTPSWLQLRRRSSGASPKTRMPILSKFVRTALYLFQARAQNLRSCWSLVQLGKKNNPSLLLIEVLPILPAVRLLKNGGCVRTNAWKNCKLLSGYLTQFYCKNVYWCICAILL